MKTFWKLLVVCLTMVLCLFVGAMGGCMLGGATVGSRGGSADDPYGIRHVLLFTIGGLGAGLLLGRRMIASYLQGQSGERPPGR
jgi:hypothetical protein